MAVEAHPVVLAHRHRLAGDVERQLPEFEAAIREYPEVVECYTVTGEGDFILRILTRDMQSYERFLRDKLTQLPSVSEVHSRIAITQVKYTTAMPVTAP